MNWRDMKRAEVFFTNEFYFSSGGGSGSHCHGGSLLSAFHAATNATRPTTTAPMVNGNHSTAMVNATSAITAIHPDVRVLAVKSRKNARTPIMNAKATSASRTAISTARRTPADVTWMSNVAAPSVMSAITNKTNVVHNPKRPFMAVLLFQAGAVQRFVRPLHSTIVLYFVGGTYMPSALRIRFSFLVSFFMTAS